MTYLKFVLFLTVISISASCNYNYYLGSFYENQARYEESYEEYQKALLSSPNNSKYQAARDRVGLKTVESLFNQYHIALDSNSLFQAYHLLNLALSIDPNDKNFLAEKEFWYRVIMLGKVELDFKKLRSYKTWYEDLNISFDFNSPNQLQVVRAPINETDGFFIFEDVLYKPTFSFISFYSIKGLNIRFKSYLDNNVPVPGLNKSNQPAPPTPDRLTNVEVVSILDYSQLHVDQAIGSFDWDNMNASGKIYDRVKDATSDWFFSENLTYNTNLSANKISIGINGKKINSIPFLPQAIFVDKDDKTFVLDFGNLQTSYFAESGWGLRRLSNDDDYRIKLLENDLLYHQISTSRGSYLPVVLNK